MKQAFKEFEPRQTFYNKGALFMKITPLDKYDCVNLYTGDLDMCEDELEVEAGEPIPVPLQAVGVNTKFLVRGDDGAYWPFTRLAPGAGIPEGVAAAIATDGSVHLFACDRLVYHIRAVPAGMVRSS